MRHLRHKNGGTSYWVAEFRREHHTASQALTSPLPAQKENQTTGRVGSEGQQHTCSPQFHRSLGSGLPGRGAPPFLRPPGREPHKLEAARGCRAESPGCSPQRREKGTGTGRSSFPRAFCLAAVPKGFLSPAGLKNTEHVIVGSALRKFSQ